MKKESKIERKNMVSARFTDEEYEPLKKILESTEVSKSELLRLLVLNKVDSLPSKRKVTPDLRGMLRVYNKTGNNINQLAKRVNTAHKNGVITEQHFRRWLNDLNRILESLNRGVDNAS